MEMERSSEVSREREQRGGARGDCLLLKGLGFGVGGNDPTGEWIMGGEES